MSAPILRTFCAVALLAVSIESAAATEPVVKHLAQDFPLSSVKLLDSPFRTAMETDKRYILGLSADRLLSGFRTEAGLAPKAEPYNNRGSWEEVVPGQRYTMAGHTLGHYLSALCEMGAATGDPELRKRAEYVVNELAECQNANGDGMLAAFPTCKEFFKEISAGDIRQHQLNNLNGAYVPFYSIHKVMCGLRDAWLIYGNEKARDMFIKQVDWLDALVKPMTDQQLQLMLDTEQGGIMESATDVYVITGDKKYLALARRLNHKAFFDPLSRGEDRLDGVHGNASIPKAFGEERYFELTGDKPFDTAARTFWNTVVYQRSFVIGGHGCNEFFFPTNQFETRGLTGAGPETCNSYNMLKLGREFWLESPSAKTADFIERTLINHILPSQDPALGGFAYFTPMGPGAARTYDLTHYVCCNATGMENHSRYGEYIYAHAGNKLWVDLLIPSELTWEDQGATIRLESKYPADGKAVLTFTLKQPRDLAISLRNPGWVKPGATKLAVNGSVAKIEAGPNNDYAVIQRTWKTGDKLEVEWPMSLHTEWLPHSTNWIAVLWGPLVLAGDQGLSAPAPRGRGARQGRGGGAPANPGPIFVGSPSDLLSKIKPAEDVGATFRTEGLARPNEVHLVPFYTTTDQRYQVYWRLMDSAQYDARAGGPNN